MNATDLKAKINDIQDELFGQVNLLRCIHIAAASDDRPEGDVIEDAVFRVSEMLASTAIRLGEELK